MEKCGTRYSRPLWRVVCDCGTVKEMTTMHLSDGHVLSCGCLRKELSRERVARYRENGQIYHLEPGIGARNHLYTQYRKEAEKRGMEFSISKEEFGEITLKNCYYCGIVPSKVFGRKGMHGSYTYNGIDRKDNSVGYIYENCLPCCWVCNKTKSNRDFDEFCSWLDRIIIYRMDDVRRELEEKMVSR